MYQIYNSWEDKFKKLFLEFLISNIVKNDNSLNMWLDIHLLDPKWIFFALVVKLVLKISSKLYKIL